MTQATPSPPQHLGAQHHPPIPALAFLRRTLRRGFITLAWIVTLAALFYGFVDWRARRAWNAYRQDYEAKNGPLALEAYVPKVIPDESNFASTPFAREWVQAQDNTNSLFNTDTWGKAKIKPRNQKGPAKFAPRTSNLVAWDQVYEIVQSGKTLPKDGVPPGPLDLASRRQAASIVIKGMQEDAKALEELRQASKRPLASTLSPIKWMIPQTSCFHTSRVSRKLARRLKTRACAELALGQSEKALEDVMLALYLADTLKDEPFLISYLVRIAIIHLAADPIWEGLAEHQWTETQLQVLQQRIEGIQHDRRLGTSPARGTGLRRAHHGPDQGTRIGVVLRESETLPTSPPPKDWGNSFKT